ncbi:seryl-tRNA synthetase [Clavulina sp. PMI_390]|nr:seryl-tRNA synthetase [Clavulina sp. PMI_390]
MKSGLRHVLTIPPRSRQALNLRVAIRNSSSGGSLPRARFNYREIAHNVTAKTENALIRNTGLPHDTVERIASLHAETIDLARGVDALRAQRSSLGKAVQKAQSEGARQSAIAAATESKEKIHSLEKDLAEKQDLLYDLAASLPNDTHPLTPIGPESAARILSTHGPSPIPEDPLRDHVHVAKALDMLDMESGAVVTGSSWYYLRNEGALLELALTNYAMSMALRAGFTPITTPDVVKADVAHRCGFQPRDEASSQNYYLHTKAGSTDRYVLAGTAEIPLAGMFAQRNFSAKELPMRVAGLGRAFRAEAGARGADTRGLYRVHQFSKVELFAVTAADDSEPMMTSLIELQKSMFDGLNLTYKVLEMPSEELGASAYMKYDMEAWMPGRGSWGEISSTSNCTDYQSRRLHILYSPQASSQKPGKSAFAHTLNGTAAAIPRLIVALLENGARLESGKVVGLDLPKALLPFWLGHQDPRVVSPNNPPQSGAKLCATTSIASFLNNPISKGFGSAMGEKPHSSITDWVEILSSATYQEDAYEGIPELVESINLQAGGPTEACRAIRKKLKYGDVHRQLRALTLLKALVENCGQKFQTILVTDPLLERLKLMAQDSMTDTRVKKKLMSVLASWHRQFKDNARMSAVAGLYQAAGGGEKKAPSKPAVDTAKLEEARKRAEQEAQERLARKKAEAQAREQAKAKAKADKAKARSPTSPTQPQTRRKPFNMQEEKPKVLASISTASQASNNLVNALKLVNREKESIETNARVQECLAEAKATRKTIVRYIQLVDDESFIGTLIDSNERIISALELYDHMLKSADADSDDEVPAGVEPQATGGSINEPELLKLQDKQRLAIERARSQQRQGSGSSNPFSFASSGAHADSLHADLQDLTFGDSYNHPLQAPIQPNLHDEADNRGSLSDYSDYDSSDEGHRRAAGPSSATSPVYGNRTYNEVPSNEASKTALIDFSDDPFADPGEPEVGTSANPQRKQYVY